MKVKKGDGSKLRGKENCLAFHVSLYLQDRMSDMTQQSFQINEVPPQVDLDESINDWGFQEQFIYSSNCVPRNH